jgi:hypothetical protein
MRPDGPEFFKCVQIPDTSFVAKDLLKDAEEVDEAVGRAGGGVVDDVFATAIRNPRDGFARGEAERGGDGGDDGVVIVDLAESPRLGGVAAAGAGEGFEDGEHAVEKRLIVGGRVTQSAHECGKAGKAEAQEFLVVERDAGHPVKREGDAGLSSPVVGGKPAADVLGARGLHAGAGGTGFPIGEHPIGGTQPAGRHAGAVPAGTSLY